LQPFAYQRWLRTVKVKTTIIKAATFVVFLARAPDFPSLQSEQPDSVSIGSLNGAHARPEPAFPFQH